MTQPLPPHPNVRKYTPIKVTGQQCGSPSLRGEFFCYFHTRVIKGAAEQRSPVLNRGRRRPRHSGAGSGQKCPLYTGRSRVRLPGSEIRTTLLC
jgi:hypothetical protein